MNQLHYENMMLKNTNYYLLCTIFNLEKQQLSKVEGELQEIQSIMDRELSSPVTVVIPSIESPTIQIPSIIEEEEEEPDSDSNAKEKEEEPDSDSKEKEEEENLLRKELEDVKQEMIVQQQVLETKIKDLEKKKHDLEEQIHIENKENQNIINKMRKENDHLHNNNNQLQSELMKILKYKVGQASE
jgi:hypothetical protein